MNCRSIFMEEERARTEDEEGASASSCLEATHVAPRTARDILDPSRARARRRRMSVKAHGKTGTHTTEPGHHKGESVHDVRASPIDEGGDDAEEDDPCRTARRPGTGANGSPPRTSRTTRSRRCGGQNCGHRAPRGYPRDLFLRVPWTHFVSEKEHQEVSPREQGACLLPALPRRYL